MSSISDDQSISSLLVASKSASPIERAALENEVVLFFLPMTHAIARRYAHKGLELVDLEQVADLALVKAMRRFDPLAGHLRGYVAATVTGELKRHFRDFGWSIRPPRHIQDLQSPVAEVITADSGISDASPIDRVVATLGIDRATATEVILARGDFRSLSLDRPSNDGGPDLAHQLPDETDPYVEADRRSVLASLLAVLSDAERELLRLRFVDELSQRDIAARTMSTQKQVSRSLEGIFSVLRRRAMTQEVA